MRLHNPESRHIHFYAFPLAILLSFMVTAFESFGHRIHIRKRQESIFIRFSKSLEITAIQLLYYYLCSHPFDALIELEQ